MFYSGGFVIFFFSFFLVGKENIDLAPIIISQSIDILRVQSLQKNLLFFTLEIHQVDWRTFGWFVFLVSCVFFWGFFFFFLEFANFSAFGFNSVFLLFIIFLFKKNWNRNKNKRRLVVLLSFYLFISKIQFWIQLTFYFIFKYVHKRGDATYYS